MSNSPTPPPPREGQRHTPSEVRRRQFIQMRENASLKGKYVPTMAELDALYEALDGFCCPVCRRKMVWKTHEDASRVVTLQHLQDGDVALWCMSCNGRDGAARQWDIAPGPVSFEPLVCCNCGRSFRRRSWRVKSSKQQGRTRACCSSACSAAMAAGCRRMYAALPPEGRP